MQDFKITKEWNDIFDKQLSYEVGQWIDDQARKYEESPAEFIIDVLISAYAEYINQQRLHGDLNRSDI